ncbi:hypothetical protein V2J09_021982 [Rumex salicifolius]
MIAKSKHKTYALSCSLQKLFKNGKKESQKKDAVTVRIHPSEEAAFSDVLNSIYDKPLNATSEAELVAVLMAADKFEVPSCVRHCSELLLKLPLTTESVVFYIKHSSIAFVSVINPLIDEAKRYLAGHFRDFTNSKLTKVVDFPDLNNKEASKCILNALISSKDQVLTTKNDYPRRVYKQLRTKVVQLELAQPQCVVFLFLNRQECDDLFPSKRLYTQTLFLG